MKNIKKVYFKGLKLISESYPVLFDGLDVHFRYYSDETGFQGWKEGIHI